MAVTWKKQGQDLVYAVINPLINFLLKIGVTPNMVTFFGLVINIAAAAVLIYAAENSIREDHTYIGWAGLIILFAGLMDMVDGRLARVGKMDNNFGALYDSVLDRYSEMVMFLGICYYLVSYDYFLSSLFAFIAMIGSVMVSYTRARAEGLGVNASVGIMQRPERILLIGIAMIACGVVTASKGAFKFDTGLPLIPAIENISLFTFPLFILAISANITALRRLFYAKEQILSQIEN